MIRFPNLNPIVLQQLKQIKQVVWVGVLSLLLFVSLPLHTYECLAHSTAVLEMVSPIDRGNFLRKADASLLILVKMIIQGKTLNGSA